MTYDLNGILIVIDKEIDQDKLNQAITVASETIDLAKRVLDHQADLSNPTTPTEKWLSQHEMEELKLIASINPKKVAENLQKLVSEGSYDCISKSMPGQPERLILFAGDRTWGCEPYGWGYRSLRHAQLIGLLEGIGAT